MSDCCLWLYNCMLRAFVVFFYCLWSQRSEVQKKLRAKVDHSDPEWVQMGALICKV